jgi:hypothetical protein
VFFAAVCRTGSDRAEQHQAQSTLEMLLVEAVQECALFENRDRHYDAFCSSMLLSKDVNGSFPFRARHRFHCSYGYQYQRKYSVVIDKDDGR